MLIGCPIKFTKTLFQYQTAFAEKNLNDLKYEMKHRAAFRWNNFQMLEERSRAHKLHDSNLNLTDNIISFCTNIDLLSGNSAYQN